MLFTVTLVVLVAMSLPVFLVLSLRRWGLERAETESRLHSPQAHIVSYLVPEGQDPAVVRAALGHAGFVTMMERGGDQRLVVECDAADRDRVREIIQHAERSGFDGEDMHLGHVRFEDDPA